MLTYRIELSPLKGKFSSPLIFSETALVCLTNCCLPSRWTLTFLSGMIIPIKLEALSILKWNLVKIIIGILNNYKF